MKLTLKKLKKLIREVTRDTGLDLFGGGGDLLGGQLRPQNRLPGPRSEAPVSQPSLNASIGEYPIIPTKIVYSTTVDEMNAAQAILSGYGDLKFVRTEPFENHVIYSSQHWRAERWAQQTGNNIVYHPDAKDEIFIAISHEASLLAAAISHHFATRSLEWFNLSIPKTEKLWEEAGIPGTYFGAKRKIADLLKQALARLDLTSKFTWH